MIRFLFFFFILLKANFGFSVLFHQYTWDEVFEKSTHVVKVEVVSSNFYATKVKLLECYTGELPGDELWVTGSRLREYDKHDRQPFLVFLSSPVKEIKKYWWEEEDYLTWMRLDTTDIYQAISNEMCYSSFGNVGVYETAGDLIRADMTSPNDAYSDRWRSLKEFEGMIKARHSGETRSIFHQGLIESLKETQYEVDLLHYLKLLELSGNQQWDDSFERFKTEERIQVLEYVMDMISQMEADEALALGDYYLHHPDAQIRSEMVLNYFLAKNETASVQLLELFEREANRDSADETVIISLLRYFEEYENPRIVPFIHTLLPYSKDYNFKKSIQTLVSYEDTTFYPIISEALENNNYKGKEILTIFRYAFHQETRSLLPFLKSAFLNSEYDFSSCFLAEEFLKLEEKEYTEAVVQFFDENVKKAVLGESGQAQVYARRYVELFSKYEVAEAKRSIYAIFEAAFLVGYAFRENPKLFERKQYLEDSIRTHLENNYQGNEPISFEVDVLIKTNTENFIIHSIKCLLTKTDEVENETYLEELRKAIAQVAGVSYEAVSAFTKEYTYSSYTKLRPHIYHTELKALLRCLEVTSEQKDSVFLEQFKATCL